MPTMGFTTVLLESDKTSDSQAMLFYAVVDSFVGDLQ